MTAMKSTKKICFGLYLHLKSGKYISVYEGTIERVWNIFNDEVCTDEFAIGFLRKSDAIEYLDKL